MEELNKLNTGEVSTRPKESTIDGCEVIAVRKGTREEFYSGMDKEDLQYGSMSDDMVQVEAEVEHNGATFPVTDDMVLYETLTDRTNLGKYVMKYGEPKKSQEVTVEFDDEGNASIVY